MKIGAERSNCRQKMLCDDIGLSNEVPFVVPLAVPFAVPFAEPFADHCKKPFADCCRKSFPGSSSSVTAGYFCDISTDSDSSVHSLNLRSVGAGGRSCPAGLREPHYQFRKSNSMRLALKEGEEGDAEIVRVKRLAVLFAFGVPVKV